MHSVYCTERSQTLICVLLDQFIYHSQFSVFNLHLLSAFFCCGHTFATPFLVYASVTLSLRSPSSCVYMYFSNNEVSVPSMSGWCGIQALGEGGVS